jgi:hypothetical protein
MVVRRFASYFTPSPGSLTLTWVAIFEFVTLSLVSLVIAINLGTPGMALTLIGIVSAPLAGLLLTLASLRERRWGARTFLWVVVNLLIRLTSLTLLATGFGGNGDPQQAFTGGLTILLTCCTPIWGLHAVLGVFFGLKAWPEFSRILQAARHQRILEMIQARGEASFAEIAVEVELTEVQLIPLLHQLVDSGELMAFLDLDRGHIYSVAALAEKQRRLLAIVRTRGQVRLADLATELHAPPDLTRQWVYHLAQRGQLHAYVDWEQEICYAPDAEALARQNAGRCPHCGGQLDLAGKGVIQCAHCGVEVFV